MHWKTYKYGGKVLVDRDTAIDENGRLLTDLDQYGLICTSHLIDRNGINITKEDFKVTDSVPL